MKATHVTVLITVACEKQQLYRSITCSVIKILNLQFFVVKKTKAS